MATAWQRARAIIYDRPDPEVKGFIERMKAKGWMMVQGTDLRFHIVMRRDLGYSFSAPNGDKAWECVWEALGDILDPELNPDYYGRRSESPRDAA